MIRLKCILARMGEVTLPDWLTGDPAELVRVFRDGSAADIELELVDRLAKPWPAKPRVNAYRLHEATAELTGDATDAKGRATTIAVLFAGAFTWGSGVYGIMFDRGGPATDEDKNEDESYRKVPRQACAVFLDTIRANRPETAAFEAETRFTTIHELGHVFNLQHHDGANYLASSDAGAVYGKEYFAFTEEQKGALATCSTSKDVWPGGSPFANSALTYAVNDIDRRWSSDEARALKLSIALPSDHFWPFEPIELDVRLSVTAVREAIDVSDRLDPGYDDFQIWIDEPNGERRRFRSPRRYCAYDSRREISGREPFHRDVTLFQDAGGLTFRRPGIHRIWAEFRLPSKRWIRSQPVEAEVLPASTADIYRDARVTLTRAAVRRVLYHRRSGRGVTVRHLEAFAEAYRDWEGVGRIEYGLGRALIASGLHQTGERRLDRVDRGQALLRRALDSGQLGARQIHHAALLTEPGLSRG